MKRFTVYALADPRTALPFYVGITTRSALTRLAEITCHAEARYPSVHKCLRGLSTSGLSPSVIVLERKTRDGIDGEKRWIAHFRAQGIKLCNISDGGAGPAGVPKSDEWRSKVIPKITGQKRSKKTRERIARSKLGKPRPDLAERNRAAATIPDEKVALIRERLALGDKGVVIARELGVSKAMVSLIKQNKRRS